jgi:Protein of unknown function (DUF3592)
MNFHHLPWGAILGFWKLLKVLGIIPGTILGLSAKKSFQQWRQNRAIAGWPTTEATIVSGGVHQEGLWRTWAELTYSYCVGEYRAGTYIRRFRKEQDADDFVRQMRDKRIQVRYDQANPDRSVLLDRDIELVALLVPELS